MFEFNEDPVSYRLLARDYVEVRENHGQTFLKVDPQGLRRLAREAFHDVSFYFRTSHLEKLSSVLKDPGASPNDRFVAETLLQNAAVAARETLPSCQDTGTAVVYAEKGEDIRTGADDETFLAHGIFETFQQDYLRYSQMAPVSMFEEKNTGTNLPAQIEIFAVPGMEYRFLFLAKGGGSSNKTFLYQETKSVLDEKALLSFFRSKIPVIGTSACPPYHLAVVIGGTSAEMNLRTVKLASAGYYDSLPSTGNESGRAFRDLEWEARVQALAEATGIGAQYGGKYLTLDVRVIRLPRHAASCPIGIGVSCSADRNIRGRITAEGIFLEMLERKPERFLEKPPDFQVTAPVEIDLNRPIKEILAQLSGCPAGTRLNLNGKMTVARDAAHARIKSLLERGHPMPDYFIRQPVYYAGPAKTPAGMVTGSFGPTSAERMDPYVAAFMARGGSLVMVAKGDRTTAVAQACKQYGGFYLGSIGGPAALLARENITAMRILDFEDLGMEAVREIEVKNFPAFVVIDSQGKSFFPV